MSIHFNGRFMRECRVVLLLRMYFSLCLRFESHEMELYCQTRSIKIFSTKKNHFQIGSFKQRRKKCVVHLMR